MANARSAGESRRDAGGLKAEPRLTFDPLRAAIAGAEPALGLGRLDGPAAPEERFLPGPGADLEDVVLPENFGSDALGVVADGVVSFGVVTVVETGPGTVTVTDGTVTGGTVTDGTDTVGTDGVGTDGVGTEGVGTDGVGSDGAGSDGVDTDGTGSDGTGSDGGPGSWADAVPVRN